MFLDLVRKAERTHAASAIHECWDKSSSYFELLRHRARLTPDAAIGFLQDDGSLTETTLSVILQKAEEIASAWHGIGGAPGDRMAIILDTSPDFLPVYFGVMRAGGVPVCLPPPPSPQIHPGYLERTSAMAASCQSSWVISDTSHDAIGQAVASRIPGSRGSTTPAALAAKVSQPLPLADARRTSLQEPALIQFTSGSTSRPKSVSVSHASLIGMIRALGEALYLNEEDIVVNWLPFYHDMGLIGYALCTTLFGARNIHMKPRQFVADPALWLKLMSRHGATFTGGASFAFRLCTRALERDPALAKTIDLSKLTRAICGGERIPPFLPEQVAKAFQPLGFHPDAFLPGYGLAENVLGVSYKKPGTATRVLRRGAAEVVSVGSPIRGCQVLIESMPGSPEGTGEIVLNSDYAGPGRVIRTGDLGFVDGGEVFIVSRLKELIIRGGENVAPEDLEDACMDLPGFQAGPFAALGVPSEETATENVVIIAESKETDAGERSRLADAIAAKVLERTGISVFEVRVVGKGLIPRTSSGKLKRREALRLLTEGKLK